MSTKGGPFSEIFAVQEASSPFYRRQTLNLANYEHHCNNERLQIPDEEE